MMEEHSSYHSVITGREAMIRLKHSGYPHCYLTRFSRSKQKYILMVYKKERRVDVEARFTLIINNRKRKIEGSEKDFDNLDDLLRYYEHARVNPSLPSIGHNYTLEEYTERRRANGGNSIGQHISYHHVITEEEAMRRIRRSGQNHCYLTYFNSEKQTYMLAVYQRQGRNKVEKHFPITISHGMHHLQLDEVMDDQESFESIDRLIQHYAMHRVDPSLINIGQNYTLQMYRQRRRCIIL